MTKDTKIVMPNGSEYSLTHKALEFCEALEKWALEHNCTVDQVFAMLAKAREESIDSDTKRTVKT